MSLAEDNVKTHYKEPVSLGGTISNGCGMNLDTSESLTDQMLPTDMAARHHRWDQVRLVQTLSSTFLVPLLFLSEMKIIIAASQHC